MAFCPETHQSVRYYQFSHIGSHAETVHGMFTRLGGQSQPPWTGLNTGHGVGDDPAAVSANHRLIAGALGVNLSNIVSPHQVHSAVVGVVEERDRGTVRAATDALVTSSPDVILMLRFADCVPILFYDPVRRVAGLAHAGWRGTVSGIARETVQTMISAFGCRAKDVMAGVGPSIGPGCYEVGDDVAQAVRQSMPGADGLLALQPNGRWHLDLWEANARQLTEAGVLHTEVARVCTACRTDEWFSHRAEHGRTGRWSALIGLREGRAMRGNRMGVRR